MSEKIKRKHNSRALRKLKIMLFAYVFCMVLSSAYTPLWLAPPLDNLTPFVYFALFLSWIPIIWKAHRRIRFDKWLIGLVLLCSVASMSMFNHSEVMSAGCRHVEADFEYLSCYKRDGRTSVFNRISIGGLETNIFYYSGAFWNSMMLF